MDHVPGTDILGKAIAGEFSMLVSVEREPLDVRDEPGIPIIRTDDYWRTTEIG